MDPPQMGPYRNLSLERLLMHIDPANPPGLHAEVTLALDALKVLCDPIRTKRMKHLAHSDLDTKLGRNPTPLDPVTKKIIEGSLEKIRDIMNVIELGYLGSVTAYESNLELASQELLHHLREAREFQRQERVRLGLSPDPESQPEA